MSRTIFAVKFKQTVGMSPIEYLTRWRMMLAGDRLTSSTASVSEIALALGYESESAFSTAFKRVKGCSPRQYGRGHGVTARVWNVTLDRNAAGLGEEDGTRTAEAR